MGKAKVDLNSVTTVGLDLAKHVFQIHAVDADGKIVFAKSLRRKDVLSFFGSLSALRHRFGGLRFGSPLGSRAGQTGSRRPPDATQLCQGLRSPPKERRG